jgi:hypothetical protein
VISVPPDERLLSVAEQVLGEADFITRRDQFADVPCLIAENPFFIVIVATAHTPYALEQVDSAISIELARAGSSASATGKQWDIYLVLLTSAHLPPGEDVLFFRVSYNTQYLRRLIRTDVPATPEGLHTALRIFLPLPHANGGIDTAAGPLDELEKAIVARGVSREFVHRAFASFRSSREVIDA